MKSNELTEKQTDKFYNKLNKRNAKNGRKMLFCTCALEAAMILYALLKGRYSNKAAYLSLYAAMFVFTFFTYFFIAKHKKNQKFSNISLNLITEFICFLVFLWGAAISLLDLKNGQSGSIVFLTIVFAVTGSLYIRPLRFFIITTAVFFTYLSFVFYISPARFIGALINHTIFFAVAVIFNRQRYYLLIKEYTREVNYKDINERLKEMNDNQLRANETLKKVSCTDALTGVNNRWGLHFVFSRVLEECRTNNKQLTVMMFDVDNFKNINDTLGHKAGDETLVVIAKIFRKLVPEEYVFRYGGEEFIVLLKGSGEAESISIAEAIRAEVARSKVENIELSISGGVFIKTPDDKSDSDEYLVGADKALYIAKAQGKNQIVLNIT